MAVLSDYFCLKCKETTAHVNGTCSTCFDLEKQKEQQAWNAMTLHDKIEHLNRRMDNQKQNLDDMTF